MTETIILDDGKQRLALALTLQGDLLLLSWESDCGASIRADQQMLLDPPELPASPNQTPVPSLMARAAHRLDTPAAIIGHNGKGPVIFAPTSATILRHQPQDLCIGWHDTRAGLSLELSIKLDGVLTASTRVKNTGNEPYFLASCTAFALPLYDNVTQAHAYVGQWADEGQVETLKLGSASVMRETHDGRPGFDWANMIWLSDQPTASNPAPDSDSDSEKGHSGTWLYAHLCHSGDSRLAIDPLRFLGSRLRLEERLAPGEILLPPDQWYQSPKALLALGAEQARASALIHKHVRNLLPASSARRPVHANTWEAVYHHISDATAKAIATAAADLGVERFILDDGWFKGRTDLKSGLGDWTPNTDTFPAGLAPLIDHTHDLGMEFGLWVEPEMISPGSDLAKAHPDWILGANTVDQLDHLPKGRDQWVLDLSQAAVVDHLFSVLDGLLSQHGIDYLKWDHNRTLFPMPQGQHAQAKGFEVLARRVKAAHPNVSLELCASGGGRVALHLFEIFDRVWSSDATDAAVRSRINQAAFQFLPAECVGTHIGPDPNPITFQRHSIETRCSMARQGHLGIELDPRALDSKEADMIKATIRAWQEARDHSKHTTD